MPPTTLTPPQTTALPATLRNQIYSTLLSNGGIRTIEATLTQLLQTSGFQAHLRAYITDLFRSGQATSAPEAYALAMGRIREGMAGGMNGVGEEEGEGDAEGGLRVPDEVVREGCRVVRRELERVVEIEMD